MLNVLRLIMPAKNSVKFYIANSIYHVYNRGVEKRKIFLDKQDYGVFLGYLKEYLSPPDSIVRKSRELHSKYFDEIRLLAYCLMPNHLHLLVRQKDKTSIAKFTKSIFTRYSMYFNKKYKRVGPLFQSVYKATNVMEEDYLLDLTKYIHLNPSEITSNIANTYSSYSDYLGVTNTIWVDKSTVLDKFKDNHFVVHNKIKSYKDFIENFKQDSELFQEIKL
jgi:putative transposase